MELKEVATEVVDRAMRAGATAAEAVVREGNEFSTVVRLGQVETLKESGAKVLGVRVFHGQRAANTYTSDFSAGGTRSARELGGSAGANHRRKIRPPAFPSRANWESSTLISISTIKTCIRFRPSSASSTRAAPRRRLRLLTRAYRTPKADLSTPPTGRKVLANSLGFVGEYKRSYCSVSAVPVAKDENGAMQRDFWYSVARSIKLLESPEEVGKVAAQRTLRRLGARKVKTSQVPVIFDPMVARSLLDSIAEAVNGDSIYRGASFLAGKLGEKVAGENVTVVDDGTMPGGFGTSPFDGEGVKSRRHRGDRQGCAEVVSAEHVHSQEAGLKTTGNASRGLAGTPGIGVGNFYLEAGERKPEQIIGDVKEGLYVTEFLGFGVNLVTGDFSRGASGMWISGGQLAFPVEEITVAGNLKDMLNSISEIGSDLEFRGSVAAPTLRIDGLTVAGE